MSDSHSLEEAIKEWLDPIDRMLADTGVPPQQRPLHAASEFVDAAITHVSEDGDPEGVEPGSLSTYAASKWFRIIFKHVREWYVARYGAAMDKPDRAIDATVLVLGTPFSMRVPVTTTEPGAPGETFWLCFHDAIRDYENPLGWIKTPPNWEALPNRDLSKARSEATAVATHIRSIRIQLMQMDADDPQAADLRDGILPHLEAAARALATGTPEHVKAAHWDMQMACERALKCLAQQRAGTFQETHDLFLLYDRMPETPPGFKRTELGKLPRWERMVDIRYGSGPPVTLRDAYRSYRATLRIVDGSAACLKFRVRMGSAKFLLKRPPWMEDV